jgi:copper resistance protein B
MKSTPLAIALWLAGTSPAPAQEAHALHDHAAMPPASTAASAGDGSDMMQDMQDMSDMPTDGQAVPATTDTTHDHAQMPHTAMDHAHMHGGGMSHAASDDAAMEHAGMDHAAMDHAAMDHAAMHHHGGTAPAATSPRTPIPAITDADRAAAFPSLHHHAAHMPGIQSQVLVDRLEAWDGGQAWEAHAWIGGDIDRVWLRSEGERRDGRTAASELEALYGHAVAPWWDLLAGVRQQFRPDGRGWAAFGVQGPTPYKVEFAGTLYLGDAGAQLRLSGDYDVLLSNRLILQPRIEATFAFSDSAARAEGDTLQAGLRLRYEISRKFAPYLGWEHTRRFGAGSDAARLHGEPVRDSQLVAGVRLWF